jgi:hypothetical protein
VRRRRRRAWSRRSRAAGSASRVGVGAAAAGQGEVASGDAAVVVDAQHRQRPAALEPAVELDQDGTDAVVGLGDLLGGDGGAAVEEPAQGWGDGAARVVQGVGEAGHHAGDEEAGGGLVTLHGVHEGVGVEALQQDLGQAHMLDDRFFSWFVHEVEGRSEDPGERLLAVFDVLDHWFRRESFRGCAFINATVELADSSHPAHEAVLSHKRRSRDYFRELAVAAGVDDPDDVSDQWMLLTEGAIVTALVEDDRDAAKRARRAAARLVGGGDAGVAG